MMYLFNDTNIMFNHQLKRAWIHVSFRIFLLYLVINFMNILNDKCYGFYNEVGGGGVVPHVFTMSTNLALS